MVVSERNPDALQLMNAQMRRIDLLCKLFGPLFIAMIDAQSSQIAMIANFAMNAVTLPIEYFTIARVYFDIPELQRAKIPLQRSIISEEEPSRTPKTFYNTIYKPIITMVKKSVQDFALYFKHPAFLPSIAGAVLYFTVLSFGGQMVTYLLSSGYSSMQIGIARTLGVIFEVLSTWAAPWLMGRIGPVRAGLWMSSWQVIMLVIGVCIFWEYDGKDSLISASGLVGGTVLSRLGLRGFDLCVQLIVQEVSQGQHIAIFFFWCRCC